MRLAHPPSQPVPSLHPRLVPLDRHPRPEIVRAHPARIQLREQREELAHLGLLRRRRPGRVRGGDGVQERPGAAAELLDVGGAVGGGGEGGGVG